MRKGVKPARRRRVRTGVFEVDEACVHAALLRLRGQASRPLASVIERRIVQREGRNGGPGLQKKMGRVSRPKEPVTV